MGRGGPRVCGGNARAGLETLGYNAQFSLLSYFPKNQLI